MKTEMTKRMMNFHIDSFGIVYHGRYLEILEEARWHYFYDNNLMPIFHRKGIDHVIVNINIDYMEKAGCGDELIILTEICKATEKSVVFKQTARRGKHCIVVAEITNVFIDKFNNRIVTVKELSEFWNDLEKR